MLQALDSSSASTFSKLSVSRSNLLSFLHLSSSSNSKKMEGHKSPHAFRSNIDSRSGFQSASLGNLSFNSKVGQSSFTSPNPRYPQSVESQRMQTAPKKAIGASSEVGPRIEPEEDPFDICRPATAAPVKLKKSLIALNREKKEELKCGNNAPAAHYLKPGMVLLKNFIGHMDQDRGESEESLNKGLPVISFSIGDSAEFLYSDVRDVDKAEKVLLESGDALIFGGKSRHIFHGVPFIKLRTAPEILTETTNLRPGRLNLTFRQY